MAMTAVVGKKHRLRLAVDLACAALVGFGSMVVGVVDGRGCWLEEHSVVGLALGGWVLVCGFGPSVVLGQGGI